ncbi:cation:proton antiporter domain-containing protein [Methanolobus halotolerans]|uniref:Potassium transporter KefB n=1 Tax=Methanolobus halotolerans TaxID=2052935 RepID=A0A4E0R0T8_9EURY|nr:cation:proton antiporter [Methanolobus halotolerans]TGC10626.1 potassium transporter KefB [Methanolobus halotolerans]
MDLTLFTDIEIIFGLSILILLVFHRIRLSPVLGFLVTGIIAGPHVLGIINEVEQVEMLAEIGIILLLFTIGVEMSIKELWDIKRLVLVGGGLQVVITTGLVYYISLFMGYTSSTALFLGFLVSLSSTAIVLKLLQEKGEMYTPYGKISLGILIFQDIVIVPMILLTPILAGVPSESGDSAATFLLRGIGIMLFVIVSARWIMPALLFRIAKTRNRELFLLTILFTVFGTAWLTAEAGLSLALGAFLAGLIISESEYSHQAIGNMMPFKDVFISFFFVSIGMLMDVTFFLDNITVLLALAAVVIFLKSVTSGLVTFILGYPLRTTIITGLTLSQVGEFSFILSSFGREYGLLDGGLYQTFLAVSIVTMAATPFVMTSSHDLSRKILNRIKNPIFINGLYSKSMAPAEEDKELHDHLIIIGYGFNGKTVSNAAKTAGIPYVIIETNPETVRQERKQGERIYYGDATHEVVLDSANIKSARVLVVGISDFIATRSIIDVAKRMNPRIYIIARTRYMNEIGNLSQLGADEVIPEEYETSVEIFSRLLKKYLVPEEDIYAFTKEIRANGYSMLRQHSIESKKDVFSLKDDLPGVDITSFKIKEDCILHGSTLKDVDLRNLHGATVLAIRRNGEIIENPAGDTQLLSGDMLIVLGKPERLCQLRRYMGGDTEAGSYDGCPV